MRTALLTVAALAAGALVVPVSMAVADAAASTSGNPGTNSRIDYRDPAQADAASVAVTGTLTPIHTETDGVRYSVALPGGTLIPVSLTKTAEIGRPLTFHGDIAIPDAIVDKAEAHGASIDDGDDLTATSSDGKQVIAAAATSGTPMPVQSATMTPQSDERTAAAAAVTPHRLYVAVISNRGTQESASSIASATASMRSYWTTESDGHISSFTQPAATTTYASSQATSANHCGLTAGTDAVWNEAAAKFSGVDFSAAGNHLMVVAPASCASGAVGIGTIGGSLQSGGRTIVTLGDTGVAVGVHELGHNLSLEHANAEQCATSCSTHEYWNLYSIMGLAVSGGSWTPDSLDTTYRVQTGIADAAEVPTIDSSTTVHLDPRGTTSGVRGALVTDPSTKARYVVEYRSGTGRDASAFYARSPEIGGYTYRPGVVIDRIEGDYDSTTAMTLKSGDTYLTSFVAGQRFSRGSVSIDVTSASPSSGADVKITLPGSTPSSSPSSSSSDPLPTAVPTDPTNPTPPPSSTPPPGDPQGSFTPGTPRVYGSVRVGQRIAVAPGSWSPRPQRYAFQWFADGRPISRATGPVITLARSVYGKRISVRVTASREGYTTASAVSAATAPVAAGRFSSRSVRIAGRAVVGRTLVADTQRWQPQPAFAYRWYANGHRIAKATGRTLEVTKKLRGKRITVRITARQSGYATASAASGRTSTVR